ncbi:hypothetical protein TRFO_20377 [Tritrichomonas foetus]|uniref:Importin N-terminal domain-containing protein n=1 Tax=Tritrichomonas foetus TaxID=1144522 RepID=A0A1J4KG76_9EUKA|nr:hypothetical protein TRFO_20377 [Tritrichomonas foetus]|eukprot:OHT10407.1 hypothetical protein TRFO_20377 [Tritrichomonas foetus]
MNEVIHALISTFQGTPDQIMQAQQYLLSMQNNPEFSTILINIIIRSDLPDLSRVAASIQLKRLFNKSGNDNFLEQLNIEKMIDIFIKSPKMAQTQLNSIFQLLIEKYVKQNQGIQFLLQIISGCFNSGNSSVFVGVSIIRFILKSKTRIFPGFGDKNKFAKFISPLFLEIAQFLLTNPDEFVLHCVLLTVNRILCYSDLLPVDFWVNFIITILQNQTETSFFDIDKDVVKFATGLIELKRNLFLPQFALAVSNAIVNKIISGISYKGINYAFRYFYQFMRFECYFSIFNVNLFAKVVLFNFFKLTQTDFQQMNEHLFGFLLNRHNVNIESLFVSPISGAFFVLQEMMEKKILLNELPQFLIESIQNGDEGTIYGAVHLSSIISNYINPEFTEAVLNSINSIQNSYLKEISYFMFFSNINSCKNNINGNMNNNLSNNLNLCRELLTQCCNNIVDETKMEIVKYFCLIVFARTVIYFPVESIMGVIGEKLPIIIKAYLEFNSKLPTNQMTISLSNVLNYFLEYLEPLSIETIRELFKILYQLINENNESLSEICTSIINFSHMMKGKSIDFFSESLSILIQLFLDAPLDLENDYENILDIMKNLIIDTPSLTASFAEFPEFWKWLIDNAIDNDDILYEIVNIMKFYAIRVSTEGYLDIKAKLETLISETLNSLISKVDENSQNVMFVQSINKLSQILFIVLKSNKHFPFYLEIFSKLNSSCFADSLAALATMSPNVFAYELNFRICLNVASPAAFLLSFLPVIQEWEKIPDFIKSSENEIKEVIIKHLTSLTNLLQQKQNIPNLDNSVDRENEEEDMLDFPDIDFKSSSSEDEDIFNFEKIISVFQSCQI